jgi:hypothetical protein
MAKNLGREYAAMTEDERRAFELKQDGDPGDAGRNDDGPAEELDLEDPRRYPQLKEDLAPPSPEA